MSVPIKEGKLLYHLTSLSNIESILLNGLQSRAIVTNFKDIADPDIVKFRDENNILNSVPFHFFLGSPFAGRAQMNNPTEEFIYITIHRDTAKKSNFKIIPTHPKHMNPLKIYNYDEGFKIIDWELMETRKYDNPECKEVCMAECISPSSVIQADQFHSIIVKSDDVKKHIESLCEKLFSHNCKAKLNIFINVSKESFKMDL
ncbi:DarT ssDNA thymidine ADP-ribosyltransferase family protein [Sulfurospirillum diekertiae]|uniref:DarT ssDNA thymidine ADP-ribosyltransferase family protein n=1 Tax=Sulfurospirillum diekertiae TaxID=1854492 RepID=UPI000B4C71AF|nr:DarT ssDNA thymidine ADP-ribosyltransferase family protein [Sulfurospirillum diekertiae]ASC94781.1 hypothetical protein Sdiek2_2784 [Sulfurospirillum diekertiae]